MRASTGFGAVLGVMLDAVLVAMLGGRSDGAGRKGGHLILEYQKSVSALTACAVSGGTSGSLSRLLAYGPQGRGFGRQTISGTPV